jgi:hypothetical protein
LDKNQKPGLSYPGLVGGQSWLAQGGALIWKEPRSGSVGFRWGSGSMQTMHAEDSRILWTYCTDSRATADINATVTTRTNMLTSLNAVAITSLTNFPGPELSTESF